jgi:hypothetical protein
MFKILLSDGTSKLSHYLDKPLGMQEIEAPRIFRKLEHEVVMSAYRTGRLYLPRNITAVQFC